MSAIVRSRSSDRAAGRLGGVGGEDGAVLQPCRAPLHEQVTVDGCRPRGPRRSGGRCRRERTLVDGGDLLPAVQLLGDVDELEVGGEGAGEHDRRLRVDAGEGRAQLVVLGLAGEAAHPLDEGEQLGALVPGQRLAEERAELAHRGAERGVLRVRRHPPAEPGDVERSAVGVAVVMRRHTGLGGLAGGHVRQV